jgi:hypothetical protein
MNTDRNSPDGLLIFLEEIYSLITLVVTDNPKTTMVLKGIISEHNIRDIISSENIHILLRKCFIRLYLEVFILPHTNHLVNMVNPDHGSRSSMNYKIAHDLKSTTEKFG